MCSESRWLRCVPFCGGYLMEWVFVHQVVTIATLQLCHYLSAAGVLSIASSANSSGSRCGCYCYIYSYCCSSG